MNLKKITVLVCTVLICCIGCSNLKNNDDNYSEDKYLSGTSTSWSSVRRKVDATDVDESSEQLGPEVTGEIKIDSENYGLAKPIRTVIRAKISTE